MLYDEHDQIVVFHFSKVILHLPLYESLKFGVNQVLGRIVSTMPFWVWDVAYIVKGLPSNFELEKNVLVFADTIFELLEPGFEKLPILRSI